MLPPPQNLDVEKSTMPRLSNVEEKRSPFFRLGRFAMLAMVSVALACGGGDKSTGNDDDEDGNGTGTPTTGTTGLYTLRTVNGDAVPTTIYEDPEFGEKEEILSGSVNLKTGSEFVAIFRFRDTYDGMSETYSDTLLGTWSKSGTTISFTDDFGDSFDGTLTTAGLTIDDPDFGVTLVFKK